ncbi:fatty acid desaturase [Francisellaceae bacterium]|nr:fatty acid desaturase [Francisellaceae bacterium]
MNLFKMKIDTKHGSLSPFIVLVVAFVTLLPLTAFTTDFYIYDIYLFLGSYLIRVFTLTACYHRLLSHKAYKTSRVFRFIMTFLCCTTLQGGPLWWASRHRHHHIYSDKPEDCHSALQHGFWQSHMGWFMYKENLRAEYPLIKDLCKDTELRLLERYWFLCPVIVVALLAIFGGWNAVVWGFCVPTFFVNQATYFVNSLVHVFGSKRYETGESSKNNWFVAITTFGEGWHNNHHRYSGAARQGFAWYEYDITFYLLKLLSYFKIVKDLRPVPQRILEEGGLAKKSAKASS